MSLPQRDVSLYVFCYFCSHHYILYMSHHMQTLTNVTMMSMSFVRMILVASLVVRISTLVMGLFVKVCSDTEYVQSPCI